MLVTPLRPADRLPVAAIADQAGLRLDLDAELGRAWAHAWVARPTPAEPPVALLVAWVVADELHLIHLATARAARRQGAARALVETFVAYAREHGSRLLLLEVRRSNDAAIALYRAAGFRAAGLRKAYYADDGEDAIEMRLTLDPATGTIHPVPDEVILEDPARVEAP
jgi:[ribosomal protein S18]-alanine N-acetyltransferase